MVERPILVQILLLGSSQNSNSALFKRFFHDRFAATYNPATEVGLSRKEIALESRTISLQVWDLGCQDMSTLLTSLYRDMSGCVLVFDVADAESFAQVERWRKGFLLRGHPSNAEHFPFILVGNVGDKAAERQVMWSEAYTWARRHSMSYIETCAQDDQNVTEMFKEAGRLASSNSI